MAKDLTVVLEDRPGTLADMGEVLGKAGVNIDGICGFPSQGKGQIHILVEDAAAARKALEAAKIHVHEVRDVLVLKIADRPGEFGQLSRKLAKAGVNINLSYLTMNAHLVLGVDNMEKALSVTKAK